MTHSEKLAAFIILLLLLCATIARPADYLTDLDGYDWAELTREERICLVRGLMIASFIVMDLLIDNDVEIPQDLYDRLQFGEAYDINVADEITAYYVNTRRLDTPIWLAAYVRNLWKENETNESQASRPGPAHSHL